MSELAGAVIELAEGSIQAQAGIEQWQQRMGQGGIGFDASTYSLIERAVTESGRKLNAEDFEQPPDLVFQIDAL